MAWLQPSVQRQRVSVVWEIGLHGDRSLEKTPPTPSRHTMRRWPEQVRSAVERAIAEQNGLQLDYIATPDENPWGRRVRVADIAFLTSDRAAVVTYDGDVWLVDGLAGEDLSDVRWQRFASGLHESLAVVAVEGVIQVATKNGVIRLYDRDGNGEADWYENFNDQLLQSQTTRSFPLDMALGPDGSTYLTQGGIVDRGGIGSGGAGTPHTGAIVKLSPDGKTLTLVASGAREPFVAVNPRTGGVTATDQQGHFIPSSVVYQVHEGDFFGFPEPTPAKLTPPLVWIPHELDTSSSSQLWIEGKGMGVWAGRLLHLSYGTGRLFIITPDLKAPLPQGTAIPLDLKTEVPLLHARMHPSGQAVYLAGFSIYGTRVARDWALGRLRPGPSPTRTAVSARTVRDGIILEFAHPLDPASLIPEQVQLRVWNYQRSAAYGSGRYAMDGTPGATRLGAAQVVLSRDQHSVFVHIPGLPKAMQLEVRHEFRFASGSPARGSVYATVHQAQEATEALAGFPPLDLSLRAVALAAEKEVPATSAAGKTVAESFGCLACHSVDGSIEGKVGPTWKGLFGADRISFEGTRDVADESYLRDRILDPQQRRSKVAQIEMPSFRGVLSEQQIESLILYIKSLAGRSPGSGRAN
ncbi:MAG TPA: c-type cytochrome [Opitutaceae bacterium]|nr:c-type cytochrome [Opitutaceae bacterium]